MDRPGLAVEHRGLIDGNDRARPGKAYAFRFASFVLMWLVVALPAAMIHLGAIGFKDTPGSATITTRQAVVAAVSNTLGPWSGHAVRTVDFPNAGLRGFNLPIALGLTALFVMLVGIGVVTEVRAIRWTARVLFAVFLPAWYGYGFYLIADGML